jgi:hypothetical protein
MAAQRAAGEVFFATLNAQLRPSALRPDLPAANAALVALMQNTKSAAAAISMINLMAHPPPGSGDIPNNSSTEIGRAEATKSARSLHKNIPVRCTTIAWTVSVAVQGGYPFVSLNCKD